MLYGKVGAYMSPVAYADEGNKDRYKNWQNCYHIFLAFLSSPASLFQKSNVRIVMACQLDGMSSHIKMMVLHHASQHSEDDFDVHWPSSSVALHAIESAAVQVVLS